MTASFWGCSCQKRIRKASLAAKLQGSLGSLGSFLLGSDKDKASDPQFICKNFGSAQASHVALFTWKESGVHFSVHSSVHFSTFRGALSGALIGALSSVPIPVRSQFVHDREPPAWSVVPMLRTQQRHSFSHDPSAGCVTKKLRIERDMAIQDSSTAGVEFTPVRIRLEESALNDVLEIAVNLTPLDVVVRQDGKRVANCLC